MEGSNDQFNVPNTSTKKSGVELGLEDIEAGRVYHAAGAEEMIAWCYDEEVISFANWE